MRYRHDEQSQQCLKTVELIMEETPWQPTALRDAMFESQRGGISMKHSILLGALLLFGFTTISCRTSQDQKPNDLAPAILQWAGKIAFTSTFNNRKQIFIMDANGNNVERLTDKDETGKEGNNWKPALSSDGTKIAFVSDRDGNTEIYLMNSNGSDQRNLTKNPTEDRDPCFSPKGPDGQRIAFHSNREKTRFQIYAMDITGNILRRRTDIPTDNYGPAWGLGDPTSGVPSKMQIAFHQAYFSRQQPYGQLWAMDEDGGNQRRLPTNLRPKLTSPANASWSPDGSRITFWGVEDGYSNIYVMNSSGSGLKQLTTGSGIQRDPSWSSDGKRIVFASNAGGTYDIWSVDAKAQLVKVDPIRIASDELKRLTTRSEADMNPSCGP